MSLTATLPFVSAAVMLVFVVLVLRRFFVVKGGNRSYYLLIWGIGLLFYFIGSLTEALHTAFGWNPTVFRVWYLTGAILVAAWLGQGTAELLIRRRVGGVKVSRIMLGVLIAASLFAAYRVFTADLAPALIADEVEHVEVEEGFGESELLGLAASTASGLGLDDGEISERRLPPLAKTLIDAAEDSGAPVLLPQDVNTSALPYIGAVVDGQRVDIDAHDAHLHVAVSGKGAGDIEVAVGDELYGHAIVTPGVRTLTPFFNMYGVILLVGGAIYSAVIFLRKRIFPNRVLGNVLIASGAMMPATGGLLSRFGLSGALYITELVGAVLIFAGFIAATTRRTEAVAHPAAAVEAK